MPSDPYIRWAYVFEILACLLVAYLVACGISALVQVVLDRRERSRLARIAERPSLSSTQNPQTR